ncbi:MAG: sulfatase, partial [Planctomycetes bacterium]|nr:sulfatase [Planctomycetota bacterium]
QPYGYNVPTPNMQKLAEEGVLFRQAFTSGPTCSPSRAGLVTGQAPHSCGMFGLAHRGWRLNDYGRHMIHTLNKVGYRSALSGIQHIAMAPAANPEDIGYDEILETGHGDSTKASAAAEYIRKNDGTPFFLSVGFFNTHRAFGDHEAEDDPRYCRPPAPLPDTPQTRKDMADFISSARRYDSYVGQVLDAVQAAGIADNTLIINTTDHGIAFPGMKCNLTDHGIGVMLIMRGPKGFTGGKVVDGMVSQIDIFPTICDVVGIDKPEWLQGKSVVPMVGGEVEEVNEEIFSEVTFHASYEPKRCIRTRRWKYIKRFGDYEKTALPNCDDGYSKDVWLECGWRDMSRAPRALYDLCFDPNEACNLAEDPAYAEVVAEMDKRLVDWMQRTGDPILDGPVPLSECGFTNPVDCMSPGDEAIDCKGNPYVK